MVQDLGLIALLFVLVVALGSVVETGVPTQPGGVVELRYPENLVHQYGTIELGGHRGEIEPVYLEKMGTRIKINKVQNL